MPLLLTLRPRIYYAAATSLLIVLITFFVTSADGPTDAGILWHHFCGCPPIPRDAVLLLYTPFAASLFTAFVLVAATSNAQSPGARGEVLFLLTRPTPRAQLILTENLLTSTLVFLLPFLAATILLSWLTLVHAPALRHLADLLQLARTTTHPGVVYSSPWQGLNLVHRILGLLANVSCICALFASQRWLALSPYTPLRIVSAFIPIVLASSSMILRILSAGLDSAIFLIPTRGHGLTYVPSTLGIATHFVFAAAWVALTLSTIRKVEL